MCNDHVKHVTLEKEKSYGDRIFFKIRIENKYTPLRIICERNPEIQESIGLRSALLNKSSFSLFLCLHFNEIPAGLIQPHIQIILILIKTATL